jgi:hypothetical protein
MTRVDTRSKKLLMVTDVPFWKRTNGSHLRIQSLLLALKHYNIEVHVWHLGQVGLAKRKWIRLQYPGLRMSFMQVPFLDPWGQWWTDARRSWTDARRRGAGVGKASDSSPAVASEQNMRGRSLVDFEEPVIASRLRKRVQRWRPDVVLLEYVSLAYLSKTIKEIPDGPAVVIDTHDIQSERNAYFDKYGWPCWLQLTAEEEKVALRAADALIAIQPEDAKVLRDWLPETPVVVAGHPCPVDLRVTAVSSEDEQVIGIIAGDGQPNRLSLETFVEQVWVPLYRRVPSARLRIAGGICDCPEANRWREYPGVELVGRVEDVADFYRQIAIAINPTWVPSGLKIKSVEAIGAGRCLVTYPPGAVGLETLQGISIAVVEDSASFTDQLESWLKHPEQHRLASRRALDFADHSLTSESVFDGLAKLICKFG